ncbi:hypothetical protein HMPREF3038_02909 [Akkermansia sp. KLE1797]|nr:hypothetical protein HMPREF3038_02909 [Akkermansia sp. KLE1797]KZA04053.1 hypothetical protein HMPREF1326_02249 [Akkermansia sp. KLE1605]
MHGRKEHDFPSCGLLKGKSGTHKTIVQFHGKIPCFNFEKKIICGFHPSAMGFTSLSYCSNLP